MPSLIVPIFVFSFDKKFQFWSYFICYNEYGFSLVEKDNRTEYFIATWMRR